MYLDQAKALFAEVTARTHLPQQVLHCTPAEVVALEQRIGVPLPEAYQEFLLWMGHGASCLFRGENVFYQDLPLNEDARDVLVEDQAPFTLPEDAFVFYMHQGTEFMFLLPNEGPNPPVHYFAETQMERGFTVPFETFSAWLAWEIEQHALISEDIARREAHIRQLREERRRQEEHDVYGEDQQES